jgi:hypothetical protein
MVCSALSPSRPRTQEGLRGYTSQVPATEAPLGANGLVGGILKWIEALAIVHHALADPDPGSCSPGRAVNANPV